MSVTSAAGRKGGPSNRHQEDSHPLQAPHLRLKKSPFSSVPYVPADGGRGASVPVLSFTRTLASCGLLVAWARRFLSCFCAFLLLGTNNPRALPLSTSDFVDRRSQFLEELGSWGKIFFKFD